MPNPCLVSSAAVNISTVVLFSGVRGATTRARYGTSCDGDNSPPMKNIIILISGTGSNMAAIVRAVQSDDWPGKLNAKVAAVISNRPDAKGLAFAHSQKIATDVVDHKQFDS